MIKKIKIFKIILFIWLVTFFLSPNVFASLASSSDLLKAYCGAEVLKIALRNLGVATVETEKYTKELIASADKNRGFNSLYEIKMVAKKAGFNISAIKFSLQKNNTKKRDNFSNVDWIFLEKLLNGGQLVANITGNRHFCLIEKIENDKIYVFIPGINQPRVCLSQSQFLEYWDRVVLYIGKKNVTLEKSKSCFSVKDNELKEIVGAQACSNSSGGGGSFSGSGGTGRWSETNGAGRNTTNSSSSRPDASTKEPVIIKTGNLYLEAEDISIPTLSLPLELKRYYNAQIVSEVEGWLPEPGAGTWVVENGEYSGQGDRVTSDMKFLNFTMEFDMQTIQPGANYPWETAWINFRYSENPNDVRKALDCYYFLIHTDGRVELAKWQNGNQYFLYNKMTSNLAGSKNHIKIVALNSNIKIYINGTLEINYTDSSPLLKEGRMALQSYFSHAHFDNISINNGTQSYYYDFNQDDNEFIFGYGWTHSYSLRIKEYVNHVTLFKENNAKEIYAPQSDGTYKAIPANNYSTLTKDASGFSLKTKFGVHYRFDLLGKLLYIDDRNLNRTTLGYSVVNSKTLLTSVTESKGRKITFQYGSNSMVSRITDPAGSYCEFFYDARNHLIKAIDRKGNVTSYVYDITTYNLIELIDSEGNVYRYNYAYNDRVNDQMDPLGNTTTFDYLWSTVHVIDKHGEIYRYNFDGMGFLQSVTNPQGVMERTINDENGNIIQHFDRNGNRTYFAYDAFGNNLGFQNAQNSITRFFYDSALNLPIVFQEANGNETSFAYDSKGNLLQKIDPEGGVLTISYNAQGQPVSATDARGSVTTFTYDSYGNLAKKTDCLGNGVTYVYDILGRLIKVIDALGGSQEYAYDKNNNLISLKDSNGKSTLFNYSPNNYLLSVTDPLGGVTAYQYDCFGNILSVTDAQGSVTTYSYDTSDQMHLNKAYLLSVTDALANKTFYEYDSLGRLIKRTDAAGKKYQFAYDGQSNLISRIDASAYTTAYQYDTLNKLCRINYYDGSFVNYSFDAVGNLTQMQDSTGTTIYSYDKLKRVKSLVYPDTTTVSYAYDLNGNRISLEISSFGKILYDYDNLNRLIKITSPDFKVAQFAYDKLSRRTQLIYPNGSIATYGYDNTSRLSQLINKDKNSVDISKFNYTYDDLSRKTKADFINGSASYVYDNLSRLTKESGSVDSKAFSAEYAYDKLGNRLTSIEDGQQNIYIYNALNQLTSVSKVGVKSIQVKGTVEEANPFTVAVNGKAATVNGNEFVSDNVSLLPGLNTITAQSTDSFGNIGTKQISVTYNETVPSKTSYSYHNDGGLWRKSSSLKSEGFYYDNDNRLETYFGPGLCAAYTYNGLGKRMSKSINNALTKYYYDGDELVLEKTSSGSIFYIHGPGIDEVLFDSRGYYYHHDGLGSIVNLTDSNGLKIADYAYKAFGQYRSQAGSAANIWGFAGRQLDQESGLYFNRNRSYDTISGRFTSQDPIGIRGGINLYAYVLNNPVNWVDPFGLCVEVGYSKIVSQSGTRIDHTFIRVTYNGETKTFGFDAKYSWMIPLTLMGFTVPGEVKAEGFSSDQIFQTINTDSTRAMIVYNMIDSKQFSWSWYSYYNTNCYAWRDAILISAGIDPPNDFPWARIKR